MSLSTSPFTCAVARLCACLASCLVVTLGSLNAAPGGLEYFYQQALEDVEFRKADQELNEAYSEAIRTLPKPERDSLRQAERFWIRENLELIQQNPKKEVEVLKQRILKRRDELLQIKQKSAAPSPSDAGAVQAQSNGLPPLSKLKMEDSPAPQQAQRAEQSGMPPQVWNQKIAANLERVYQMALKDSEFEAADARLRSAYKKALTVLPLEDRGKLKLAEKAWVRENGFLVYANDEGRAGQLKERTLKRADELEGMVRTGRFEAATAVEVPKPEVRLPEPAPLAAPAKEEFISLPTVEPSPAVAPATPTPVPSTDQTQGAEEQGGVLAFLLGGWIFCFVLIHCLAMARRADREESNAQGLNVAGLYFLTAVGLCFAFIPLMEGPALLAVLNAVFVSLMSLASAWFAAVELARGFHERRNPRQAGVPHRTEGISQPPVDSAAVVGAAHSSKPDSGKAANPKAAKSKSTARKRR